MPLNQIRVRTEDLEIGMYVAALDRPWLETPYKVQGLLVKCRKDIDKLLQFSDFVLIDINRSRENSEKELQEARILNSQERKQLLVGGPSKSYQHQTNFDTELQSASKEMAQLSNTVGNLMNSVANNEKLKMPALKKAVTPMVESIIRLPSAFAWLAMMKSKDDYTFNHSVSASIWAVTTGRSLGLPKKDLYSLAIGALLFDVGKLKLPEQLINSPNRFSPAEFRVVMKHVDYSVEIVKSIPGITDDVVQMVATHHERYDGKGYPKKLVGNKIPLFGRIAGIVDCYDALITDRPFASAISPHDAIQKIYNLSGIDFQTELVEQFIQVMGIYPVGTIVELSDERVGVVVAHHEVWRLRPKIMLLLDKEKHPYPSFDMLDMYLVENGEDGCPLKIIKTVEPGMYGIDSKQFYL